MDRSLASSVLQPLWSSHPHQDVRVCLVVSLLHFAEADPTNESIWTILEEAASDDYTPVIQTLFLPRKAIHSDQTLRLLVDRVQMRTLDHHTKLDARRIAWAQIDTEYVNQEKLIEKAKQILFTFDKNANQLVSNAFEKLLAICERRTAKNEISS